MISRTVKITEAVIKNTPPITTKDRANPCKDKLPYISRELVATPAIIIKTLIMDRTTAYRVDLFNFNTNNFS
jgi:hypothetical protein